ncbi:MAG: hypothetical protein GVX78_05250, partial [Bacteroidetes bacterium]|nr:hypothetical protein [Bacteroidota bacterium]
MRSELLIYSSRHSKALSYVLDFIFDDFFGCGYQLVHDLTDAPVDIALNYSSETIPGVLQIVPNKYLFSDDLRKHPFINLSEWRGIPVFFQTPGDLPFDLFSTIFFLLSRAEEYSNNKRDEHGRFLGEYSLFDSEIIERPLIDEWLHEFKAVLVKRFSSIENNKPRFRWINTYDIDVAYAYRFRSPLRLVGANAKNLLRGDYRELSRRYRVLSGKLKDPYDSYELQKEISHKHADLTHYFILVANKSKYDRNLAPENTGMRNLLSNLRQFARVGLHPSYRSGV